MKTRLTTTTTKKQGNLFQVVEIKILLHFSGRNKLKIGIMKC